MFERVFLIVLDSLGVGAQPDSHLYGDKGSNTLLSLTKSKSLLLPNLKSLGLFNIYSGYEDYEGLFDDFMTDSPLAYHGFMAQKSPGKDTTTGHWEIAGLVLDKPFPTYPDGFDSEIIDTFSDLTGKGVLCNLPYSGTQVIEDYGQRHIDTGNLIVYTSADSVFQIAAHENIVPLDKLYEYCEIARALLQGKHGVGRVIARPFLGQKGGFFRTANRKDYSLPPVGQTMLDIIANNKLDVIGVGKISDIFAGRSITSHIPTKSNLQGQEVVKTLLGESFNGLAFVNLVDFDMLYGHRNDINGYALALSDFDRSLGEILKGMKNTDLLIITADHGCDPGFPGTDHTREYVPVLAWSKIFKNPKSLGKRESFADIGATITHALGLEGLENGVSFYNDFEI